MSARAPRLATIPPYLPFLDTLAGRWLDEAEGDPSLGLILLPTRRAARALADSFLHVSRGAPMLLPRITAIGGLEEAPLAMAGALDLPPAVPSLVRLAALARMVMALPPARGGVAAADRAWALAGELARLMDEAEQAEVPLAEALARAADGAYAEHWEATLRFLDIVTSAWPEWLAANGFMNPVARQTALLDEQGAAWRQAPPPGRIWVAGLTGAVPAVARLLRSVAGLPRGLVLLPWLDIPPPTAGGPEETHPQAGLADLLASVGATAGDVAVWDGAPLAPPPRADLLAEALLPAGLLDRWRVAPPPEPTGLFRLDSADQQEEAVAVALVLRDALETPGKRAALVTPDRDLARRVSAELLRWGVVADDSAGEPLAETPAGVFLRVLARAWVDDLAPVPLLALLKHPLAAAGMAPATCRAAARGLERSALRGARPSAGFTGLRRAVDRAHRQAPGAAAFVERLRGCLEPVLLPFTPDGAFPPTDLLAGLVRAAEALAATDTQAGADRLWSGEEGEALANLLAEALPALAHLPPQPIAVVPGLLDALLSGAVVRGRRALRGRDLDREHPRLAIWGLLEARLQAMDVVVLGGLAEGVWPPATDPGPWMSRPMRARAGLPGADRRIGEAAHDFVLAACAAPLAVLSAPRRRDGAPAVPSRWLARLEGRLGGALPRHPAVAWARALDQPARRRAIPAPHPCPPLALRPRRLSASDVETLIADPYAVYAKHVLRLRPLDPLDQDTDSLDYGNVVHRGLELFLRDHPAGLPPEPARALRNAMAVALEERAPRPAVRAWWLARLERIADWVAAEEVRRRAVVRPRAILAEHSGHWRLGETVLTAKADRIEIRADGTLAIVDYKTGTPPTRLQLHDGSRPQLALEAVMAEAGAFPGVEGSVRELIFWHLTGGREPGVAKAPLESEQEVRDVVGDTPGLIANLLGAFADPAHPYPHCPHPGRVPQRRDYAHLARAAEVAGAGDEG